MTATHLCHICGRLEVPAQGSWCDECIDAKSCACSYTEDENRFDPCEEHAPSSRTWPKGAWPGC